MIDSFRQLIRRILAFFRPEPLDRELEAEMASHIEFAVQENLQRGMSVEKARHQAMIRFGGMQQARERHRQTRGLPTLEVLLHDLRYTFRTLRRDSGFTLIAVLILALGIGANIAVFSVVNTILLQPLPFRDPQQLIWITRGEGKSGLSSETYSVDGYEQLKSQNSSFQDVTGYFAFETADNYKLMSNGVPRPVSGISVVGNFFQVLGVEPFLGRLFTAEECQKGGRPAVLLAYPFWKRQFNGDPGIIGRPITFNGQPMTVVGVLPSQFDFGSVFSPGAKVDMYVPAILDDMREWGNTLALIGRLKPQGNIAKAQTEGNLIGPRLYFNLKHPEWGTGYTIQLTELKEHVSGRLRRSLLVLWFAVGLILLIVCVNLSNLLLARTATRNKEFAMRRALGAGRVRLICQLLTESLVLSLAGAVLGLGIAFAITFYLAHQEAIALPLLSSLNVDRKALEWTVLIAVFAAVLFGITPAWKMSGNNLQEALKDTGPSLTQGKQHDRMRSLLVVSEIALACVLLAGAGLLLRSFLRVVDVDLGFQPDRAAAIKVDYNSETIKIDISEKDGGARRGAILQEILRRVKAIPGIESAGVSDNLPLDMNRSWGLSAKGKDFRQDELPGAFVYIITPGFFDAIGMHVHEGRDFDWHDASDADPVVIINQAAARRLWPSGEAIGQVALINGRETRVVGVVSDIKESSPEKEAGWQMYLPVTQAGPVGAELVVRTKLPADVLASSVMSTLRSVNPEQPATEFRTIQQLVDHAVSPRRFFMLLVTVFATLGLILAALGIYGVISYSVTRQTQEIGIRMALGASRTRVQLSVLTRTLALASLGVVLGTIASFGVSKAIASLLFGTEPTDPQVFAGVILLLGAVALIAGYIPAFRASRVNPMVALRNS
jgi:predicted permease